MLEGIFLLLVFIVAALYSSVGHGGASGYLALMVLFGLDISFMKGSALVLNVIVAGISWYLLYKSGHFKIKLAFPFCLTSVPAAYIGSGITVNSNSYKFILGILLLIAVANILVRKSDHAGSSQMNIYIAMAMGALIGFFSGMIGIGGGIILSPLMLLFRWSNMKETAAVSAFFILLNSLSAIVGMYRQVPSISIQFVSMIIFALAGGLLGSWYTNKYSTPNKLKYILSVVLLFAAFKLILWT